MKFKNIKKLFIMIAVISAVAFAFNFSYAQTPVSTDTLFGGDSGQSAESLADQAGLGTSDPRIIIARVINIILGFLGIIAIGLITYAGYMWMTAEGNEQKIEQAKKLLIGAVIGLAIILSAFGIATFVIRALGGATGTISTNNNGGNNNNNPGDISYPSKFLLTSTSPANDATKVARNKPIKFFFNSVIDIDTVAGNFTVEPTQATGNITYEDNNATIVFTPNGNCESSVTTENICFPKNLSITATATQGLQRVSVGTFPVALDCSSSNVPCSITFTTSDEIDLELPIGASCSSPDVLECSGNNLLCASDYCGTVDENCVCQNAPIIDWISPVDEEEVPNGAPGNLITIGGRYFGNIAGKVYFTCAGDDCVVEAQLASTVNNLCTGSWSDNAIVVVVPENAITGPIGVVDVSGKIDRTDYTENERGPKIPDFQVNDIKRPGICKIDPAKQEPLKTIDLAGINFGASSDNNYAKVKFGTNNINSSAVDSWTDQNITGVSVPILTPQTTTVAVDTGERSNSLYITIDESKSAPVVYGFEPKKGPAGTYVTITGANFGEQESTVTFINPIDNAFFSGDLVNFPEQCLDSLWTENQIIVKVPQGLTINTGYKIKITNNNGLSDTSSGNFVFNDDAIKPNLCAIKPNNGPVGQVVEFFGDNFSDNSNAIFAQNKIVAMSSVEQGTGSNTDTGSAIVPSGAVSGQVVIKNNTEQSNPFDFRVGSCLDSGNAGEDNPACADSGVCCANNTQLPGSCVATQADCGSIEGSTYSQYYIEFSTTGDTQISCDGDISTAQCDANATLCETAGTGYTCNPSSCLCEPPSAPKVIEECDRQLGVCLDKNFPSPSPWTPRWDDDRGEIKACINSVITVRFTEVMDKNTLNRDNVILKKCNNGDVANGKSTVTGCGSQLLTEDYEIFLQAIDTDSDGTNDEGQLTITPIFDLEKNSWYQVTLKGGGIKSNVDIPLEQDYSWSFQTRDSDEECRVGCVEVQPDPFTAKEKGEIDTDPSDNDKDPYTATPQADDNACIMFNGSNKSWQWSATYKDNNASDYVTVSQVSDSNDKANVTAKKETAGDEKVHVIATENASKQSDYGNLKISFAPFVVEEKWPDCSTACINAETGVRFSKAVLGSTINTNNIILWDCVKDVQCVGNNYTSLTINPSVKSGLDNKEIVFGTANFEKTNYYRAIIKADVLDIDGKKLESLNFNSSDPSSQTDFDSYSWVFGTKDRVCEVDRVSVAPQNACVNLVGETADYGATPYSSPDECSANGQRLKGEDYNWNWTAQSAKVAVFTPDENISNDTSSHISTPPSSEYDHQETVKAVGSGNVLNEKQTANVTAKEYATQADNTTDFCIQCGWSSDSQCVTTDGNSANTTYGVGANTCCYPRPTVESSFPEDSATNICRNIPISVTFDREMDIKSFGTNFVVAANYGTASCPAGTDYLLLSDARDIIPGGLYRVAQGIYATVKNIFYNNIVFTPVRWAGGKLAEVSFVKNIIKTNSVWASDFSSRWCAITGKITGSNYNGKTTIEFYPDNILKANTKHAVLIKGDSDITDDKKVGVVSVDGVSMRGKDEGEPDTFCDIVGKCKFNGQDFYGEIIDFTTLGTNAPYEGICPVDHVEIYRNAWLFTSNQNDTRDDNINDKDNYDTIYTDNDKEFKAMMKAEDDQELISFPNVYGWEWTWSSDNLQIVTTNGVADSPDKTMAKAQETKARANTYIKAKASITSRIPGLAATSEKSAKAPVYVFICDNPWPVFDLANTSNWPFKDKVYNFETYYCRDKGDDSINDDLPVLNPAVLSAPQGSTDEDILKQYLLTYSGGANVPSGLLAVQGIIDGIGDVYPRENPDGDGVLDSNDSKTLSEYALELTINYGADVVPNYIKNSPLFKRADIDKDEFITDIDTRLLIDIMYSPNNVALRWTSVSGASQYNIYQRAQNSSYSNPKSVESSAVCENSQCSFALDSLTNGQTYYFAITSIVSGKESAFSEEVSITPQRVSAANAPGSLQATKSGNNFSLTWGAVNEAESYGIAVGYGSATEDKIINVGNNTSYDWPIDNNSLSQTHYFKVRAIINNINGSYSSAVSIDAVRPILKSFSVNDVFYKNADGVINIVTTDQQTVMIEWVAKDNDGGVGLDQVEIRRATKSDECTGGQMPESCWSVIGAVPVGTFSRTASLPAEGDYYFSIKVPDKSGNYVTEREATETRDKIYGPIEVNVSTQGGT